MKIPLPGLIKPVGLGDMAKAVTSAVGVKPCGGCRKRAERMNRALTFTPADPPSSELPGATVGELYSAEIPGPVVGGSIPPGLTLDSRTRILSGTPTVSGRYAFYVSDGGRLRTLEMGIGAI